MFKSLTKGRILAPFIIYGFMMQKSYSIYLDFLRVLAAVLVFTGHCPVPPSLAHISAYLYFGHDSVVIFFVLSGYVISYAADQLDKTGYNYVVNRIARILPVAVTAVVLAFVLDSIGVLVSPDMYPRANELKNFWFFPISFTFLNELWWLNIKPFSNGPYWSLVYEVWDYVLFGILTFTSGRRRVVLAALVFLITGPKFWLLMPIWFVGVLLYKMHKKGAPSGPLAFWLTFIPLFIYIFLKAFNPGLVSYHWISQPIEEHFHHGLDGANNFAWDYVLAILFATHLYAIRGLNLSWLTKPILANPIRTGARYTFSLYLYHFPFLCFFMTMLRKDSPLIYEFTIYACILAMVVPLARCTEFKKKQVREMIHSLVKFRVKAEGSESPA